MATLDNPNTAVNESTVPFLPTAMKYGGIGGLVYVLYGLVMNMMGMPVPTSLGMMALTFTLIFAIGITVAVLAIKHHRNNELGGYVSFGRAFLVGFLVLAIAAVISTVFQMVYVLAIDPGIVDVAEQNMEKMLSGFGMPEDALQQSLQGVRDGFTPGKMLLQGLVYNNIFNAVIALIIAAIMKRKPAL